MKRLTPWLILLLVGCSGEPAPQDPASLSQRLQQSQAGPRVVAVSYPLQQLTLALVGDDVQVEFPCQGPDPQTWKPDRAAILNMQSADLVIANGTGADYAKWLTTVSLPEAKLRQTASRGLSLADFIAVEDVRLVHSHGPEGEHSHPLMISRTWLDPRLARKQATYLSQELQQQYPALREAIVGRERTLAERLDSIAAAWPASEATARRVLTATPDMKFLTRFAGLEDRHFQWEAGTTLQQAQSDLAAARQGIEEAGQPFPKLLLVPRELPLRTLPGWPALLQSQGLAEVPIDLIDLPVAGQDFLDRLQQNLERLGNAISAE